MEINKYLISCILKNKVHLGNSKINKDIKNFIYGVNNKNGKYIFDVFKQVGQIRKVSLLLKNLKKRKKPILFFGINQLGLDSKSKEIALSVNKSICSLSFSYYGKDKSSLDSNFNDFYSLCYEGNLNTKNPQDMYDNFNNFDQFIEKLKKNREVEVNGYFFDSWSEGFISNFHYLKSSLDNIIKENKYSGKSIAFLNRLKILKNLSIFLDRTENMPGAAIFFSKIGYDHFFKEFKKMGIPVVCIVNSDESLQGIDFPLLGDNSSLNTIYFYQEIMKNSLELGNQRILFKNKVNN